MFVWACLKMLILDNFGALFGNNWQADVEKDVEKYLNIFEGVPFNGLQDRL